MLLRVFESVPAEKILKRSVGLLSLSRGLRARISRPELLTDNFIAVARVFHPAAAIASRNGNDCVRSCKRDAEVSV